MYQLTVHKSIRKLALFVRLTSSVAVRHQKRSTVAIAIEFPTKMNLMKTYLKLVWSPWQHCYFHCSWWPQY